jgi:phosphohistidine swiveling domain-containing protein
MVLFSKVNEAIKPMNVYVWVAHAAEEYYRPVLKDAVKNYVSPNEVDKFVGDVSFPIKKNAHVFLEEDVRACVSVNDLQRKYGWMKARTSAGFAPGYTLEEMEALRKEILTKKPEERFAVVIPDDLQQLVSEVQELVYLRTLRTDAIYELYFLARPIFARVAEIIGVKRIDYCLPDEILAGRGHEYPDATAVLQYYDDYTICDSIFKPSVQEKTEFAGQIAWGGKVGGIVKIVQRIEELGKVNDGDVLVTNMTIPAYISAMKKAVAFVTNEGGITCHAAIIAREMKKPCIIGTKIATQVLKDGDMIEVDANHGIVRKL